PSSSAKLPDEKPAGEKKRSAQEQHPLLEPEVVAHDAGDEAAADENQAAELEGPAQAELHRAAPHGGAGLGLSSTRTETSLSSCSVRSSTSRKVVTRPKTV